MPTTNEGSRKIRSNETMFSIVELIRELDGAGVTELAVELGMAKSAVHKHLVSLEEHGFVTKSGTTYDIGLQFLNYGIYARDRVTVYEAAKKSLEKLAEETGERVDLIVEQNGIGVFVEQTAGENNVKTDARLGARMYLHCTSGGKAILAEFSDEKLMEVIERYGLPRQTENTITDLDTLLEELAEIRERGFAINTEESIKGVHAIGVPILEDGTVLGAVSIAGAANRLSVDYCKSELSKPLLAAANEIELNYKYA